MTVSDLPNRAYRLIWNEFFRDENLQSPVPVYTDDTDRVFGSTISTGDIYGKSLLKACKHHDYFTSCLPNPQKGSAANIPLAGTAPVTTGSTHSYTSTPMTFHNPSLATNKYFEPYVFTSTSSSMSAVISANTSTGPSSVNYLYPDNLWADLSTATSATINSLRQAFAVQRLLETDARCGSRYREILQGHFGVTSPDASQ